MRPDAYFMRETIVPLERLKGIECTTLEDIRACDPSFDAKQWNVRRVLFLDTETTGLSGGAGTLAFEIGLGFLDERGMVIRQYVMRGYEEEAAMLDSIASMLKNFDARLRNELQVPVHVAENALHCVVDGCSIMLQQLR